MKIQRLSEIIQVLKPDDRDNLRAFLLYRKIPTTLFDACVETQIPINKELLLMQLSLKPRAFDSMKSKLLSAVVEWHILNRDIWVSKQAKQLIEAHLMLQWGEATAAYKLAQKVQLKAENDARLTLARLALEIKSSAAQSVFQHDATAEMMKITEEMERMVRESLQNTTITSAYVHAAALAEQSMLLRTNKQKIKLDELTEKIKDIDQENPNINFQMWAYRINAEAYLQMVRGDFQAAFNVMDRLWQQMIIKPYRIPIEEHRFYLFFQTYTSTALRAEQWEKAEEATILYQHAIDEHFGNDQRKKALAHTFATLIEIGRTKAIADRQKTLMPLLHLFLDRKKTEQGNFDISSWELFISVDIIPILIKRAFENELYKECNSLLSLVSQFKLKKANIATDLIILKPLVQQVLLFELVEKEKRSFTDRDFFDGANQCYEIYRSKALKNTHPIEWVMARLFRGIAHNQKKSLTTHFQQCHDRIQQIKPTCLYYQGLNQIFDFDSWLKSKL